MKTLLAVSILFFSASLANAACPMLAGDWSCQRADDGSVSSLNVTQEDIPGGVLYKVTNQEGEVYDYPADGVLHRFEDEDGVTTVLVTCTAPDQIHSIREGQSRDGFFSGKLEETIKASGANSLYGKANTKIALGGIVHEHEFEISCRKTRVLNK